MHLGTFLMGGWMDDLQFYILFRSISVISGQCDGVIKGFVLWSGRLFTVKSIIT